MGYTNFSIMLPKAKEIRDQKLEFQTNHDKVFFFNKEVKFVLKV